MTICSYSPGVLPDIEPLIDLFTETVRRVCIAYTPQQRAAWAPIPPERTHWEQALRTHTVWVAEQDGKIVGFTDLTEDGLLDHLYVHWHYQRQGIASELVSCLEKEARQRGLAQIETDASRTARPFFERRGYVVQAHQEVLRRGVILDNFHMIKRLI